MTSGPITLWTGKEGQITVPEGDTVRSSNTDIVSVEKNGTAVTLTGGSKEGRAEVTAGESTWVVYNYASEAEYNYLYALFHEKRISVMGDSISTIKDKIPSGNALYYDNTTGKEMTFERNYWGDIITRFGAAEGIDEAWSGSTIGSKAASMASKDRINKLDDNGTPDVILYYGGSNPDSSVGAFDPDADYAKTVDWAQSYSDTASAYAASLQRMKATYPGAEIIAIIPYYEQNNIPKQAEVIEQIAKHYDITTIDLRELRNQEGISPNNELHPNMDGHSQIAAYICQQLYEQQAVTPNEKTVTYDANGGSFKNGSDPIKQSVTAKLPKATRAGYAFVGWFDQAAGGNKVASALDTAIPSGMQDNLNGTTLYAHWTRSFTWDFDNNLDAVDADGNVIITVSAEHGSTTLNDDNTVKFNDYQGNFTASIPYELEQLRAETKEFLDDLSTRDQRMIFANVTIVHMADTLEQLDADTETLQAIGLEQACQFSILRYQQEDGLNTALPYGLRRIKTTRTLTTESTAVLMPFRVQEIQDAGGIYYGVNAVSKNLLICNRKKLLNPHGFVLGVSGSGKSFSMKEAITFIALSTNDDIIMIDAEREYGELTRALQGSVLEISPSSPHHINPLDINRGYGAGENPVAMKSELMMSICEQQMGVGQLGAYHKSIIDRCTANIYHDFIKSGGEGQIPTLPDWRNEVKRQPEREAQELALASELFVEGSLNMFAHETNFDIDNRIICFDLYEMGEQLKPTALNVVLETIQNRVAANRLAGRYTWVFVDEVYLFFKYYYSAQFLYKCWKRFRKYAAAMTAATQNIEECLHSETARLMLANSEFLILLNQAATDRAELAKLLHISETQMSHVTNVEAGHGLMRIGSSIIPFVNEFPRDGALYRLMTTTPGDK